MFFSYTVISELEASLSSPNKAVSTDKSVKDDSKFNGQLRSRIKVQNMTDKKKVWQQAYMNSVQYSTCTCIDTVSLSLFVYVA